MNSYLITYELNADYRKTFSVEAESITEARMKAECEVSQKRWGKILLLHDLGRVRKEKPRKCRFRLAGKTQQ